MDGAALIFPFVRYSESLTLKRTSSLRPNLDQDRTSGSAAPARTPDGRACRAPRGPAGTGSRSSPAGRDHGTDARHSTARRSAYGATQAPRQSQPSRWNTARRCRGPEISSQSIRMTETTTTAKFFSPSISSAGAASAGALIGLPEGSGCWKSARVWDRQVAQAAAFSGPSVSMVALPSRRIWNPASAP